MSFKRFYSLEFAFTFSQDNADSGVLEFLVGAQTEDQKKILENYVSNKPLYVEGPFFIWVRRLQRYFFTLRTDAEFDEKNGEGKATTLTFSSLNARNFICGLHSWQVF